MKCPTVKIESNGASLTINEADYNPKKHKLWEDTDEPEQAEPESATEYVENDVKVIHKGGGRWFVLVNDQSVHEGTLTKAEAKALAAEY